MSRRRRDRRKFFQAFGPVAPLATRIENAPPPATVVPFMDEKLSAVLARPVEVHLESLTVAQLRALAAERGVVLGMQRRTKAAIIEALRA